MRQNLVPLALLIGSRARRVGKWLSQAANTVPLLMLIGGVLAASSYAYLWFCASDERPIQFAIACLVAVLGWRELTATDELYERD